MTQQACQLTYHYADGSKKVYGVSPNQREFKINYPLNNGLVAITGQLPPWIEEVKAIYCDELKQLPTLNDNLKSLLVSYCKSLPSLLPLPAGLETLIVDRCPLIETLGLLPQGLQYLKVDWCDNFTTLTALPQSLVHLDVWNCHKCTTLPKLPYDLGYLRIHGEVVLAAGIERMKKELNSAVLLDYIWRTGYIHLKHAMIMQYGLNRFIAESLDTPQIVHKDESGILYKICYLDSDPIYFVEITSTDHEGRAPVRCLVDPLIRTITIDSDGEPSFSKSREKTARNAVLSTQGA